MTNTDEFILTNQNAEYFKLREMKNWPEDEARIQFLCSELRKTMPIRNLMTHNFGRNRGMSHTVWLIYYLSRFWHRNSRERSANELSYDNKLQFWVDFTQKFWWVNFRPRPGLRGLRFSINVGPSWTVQAGRRPWKDCFDSLSMILFSEEKKRLSFTISDLEEYVLSLCPYRPLCLNSIFEADNESSIMPKDNYESTGITKAKILFSKSTCSPWIPIKVH